MPGQPEVAPNEKRYGFVAVCAGAGLEAVFRDLGVDGMVSGGQTMNPSTERSAPGDQCHPGGDGIRAAQQ